MHIPRFENKGRFIWSACSCGWRGKRGSYGNSAGWGYLRAAVAEEWLTHAKEHGLTDINEQIRIDGVLQGTVQGTHRYRRRGARHWMPGTLASRAHTIIQMMTKDD